MKEQLINEIQRKMLPYLNNEQLMQLTAALTETLQGATICFDELPSTEPQNAVEAFITAKRIEGCSEKTLAYYRKTIEAMISGIGKTAQQITTDELRKYLTNYQVQRGTSKVMLLHGSCVTDGTHSILLTGDSGAGKSTLAAEFLSHGWKLLTDDVTAIPHEDGLSAIPMVQASYPSQKLWQDSLRRYTYDDTDIHSLYLEDGREKFGVHVAEHFWDGRCPLSLIVRLIPTDTPCSLQEIHGMTEVDQLLRNTYRLCLIPRTYRERHFQRCVTLAGQVPMVVITQQRGTLCANTLYEMIIQ